MGAHPTLHTFAFFFRNSFTSLSSRTCQLGPLPQLSLDENSQQNPWPPLDLDIPCHSFKSTIPSPGLSAQTCKDPLEQCPSLKNPWPRIPLMLGEQFIFNSMLFYPCIESLARLSHPSTRCTPLGGLTQMPDDLVAFRFHSYAHALARTTVTNKLP